MQKCDKIRQILKQLHSFKHEGRELKLNRYLAHFPSGAGPGVVMGYSGVPQLQNTNGPAEPELRRGPQGEDSFVTVAALMGRHGFPLEGAVGS